MADLTAERVVGVDVILTTAWTNIILRDDERDYHWFSTYQRQATLKDILYEMFQYLLPYYNEFGVYDYNVAKLIVTCYRPKSTREHIEHIANELYKAMSSSFGLPRVGYRIHFRVDGRCVRFYPRLSRRYDGKFSE